MRFVLLTNAILGKYLFKVKMGLIAVALPSKEARTLRSWVGIPQESVSVLSYVGSGLETGRYLAQGVLPIIYTVQNFRSSF
jgi:hypothetical protein